MENRAHAIVAGLFLLLLGAALVTAVAWFQGDHTERALYTVVARTGVPGLNLKAPVKLRGVEVGTVEAIAFDPTDARQILVTIAVDKAAPLGAGSYAQLGLQGVTGLSFIALEEDAKPGAGALVRATPGARFPLRPTFIDRLAETGPELVAGFTETARRLNALLSDANRTQWTATAAQLGRSADEATRLMSTLQTSAAALPGLIRTADQTLQRADSALAQVQTLAADGSALSTDLRQRAAVLDELGRAARQLASTTRELDLALVGAHPPRTTPLLDELSAAAGSARRTLNDLDQQPNSLLFGRSPPPAGPGERGFEARPQAAQ
jgi:phospholipid/cholesterol/gamma-HCH transport system substrate-binding protein